jgi:FdhD protein
VSDRLVVEAPLELRLGAVPIAVLMRTPGDDTDLARGFALTEGIVLGPRELAEAKHIGDDDQDARIELVLADGVSVDPERFRRNLYATSSCGVCGKASIDAVRIAARKPPEGPVVTGDSLGAMMRDMASRQVAFAETGGLHAAAIFEAAGALAAIREDIGRHNAVDKAVGHLAPTEWPLGSKVMLVSGRVSFEVVQKAAVAGIPLVAGVSAASTLAVELAEELGMTVIGFLREGGFTIYTGEHRVS